MQNINQLHGSRELGVTLFRAGLLTLLGAGLATAYLLSAAGTVSAAYGGVCFALTAALVLAVAFGLYLPAQHALSAQGVRGTILRHLPVVEAGSPREERDILDRLEKDLDF